MSKSIFKTTASYPNLRNWLSLGILALVWGSSFILIKRGLEVYSPIQVGALRIGISAIAFLPVFILQIRKINWSKWKIFLAVGLTGSGIPAFLFPLAQTHISSAMTGVLNSLTPLFTLLLGLVFFSRRFKSNKLFGVLVGFSGAVLLVFGGSSGGGQSSIWYSLIAVGATVCYGTSVNIVGKYLKDTGSLIISAVSFVFVGFPALGILFSTDFVEVLRTHEQGMDAFFYISILSLGGTVLASLLFYQLVHWTSPVFSASVAYIIPLVAILWGVFDGEVLNYYHLISAVLIIGGLYLTKD